MSTPAASRIHGLDTLRALAVTLVVLHHYVLFVSDAPTFGWVGEIGWAGVDLFFALSGYLIGNQIFAGLRDPNGFSLRHFYARRLLRTLPNFWVVLALYALWPAFRGDAPLLPLWRYLTFTQNIHLEPGTAFSHAWSLCIEEQFYMLLPALALLATVIRAPLRWAWLAIGAAFLVGMAVRWQVWLDGMTGKAWLHHYYKYIYYASWCRFDELLAGVALALLKNGHRALWIRVMRHGNYLLAAGGVVTALAVVLFLHDHYGLGVTVFGYPLLALGFSLLTLAALAPGSLLHRLRVPGAASLALWSYAVYLVHKQVCVMVAACLARMGYGAEDPITIGLSLAASLLAGWLLYRLVETPFMALRARLVPANGRAPAAPLGNLR
ncbi:acyltransferase [Herbaspirillum sp. SJZ107]|uniref:acyltransferase family protein n=1 Tax=Herbaspirillum sp. SJZ107 TaxID=2572881 RepID=UPI0011506209|nr:acyltransferase [Herbaspirillum sp. SJZ107]TQK11124.1 peptidoglycan/LPS O-acetylase OafA/YrhL [Herbaspirillum sp. SJZ107]